ncbi:MAG: hypothetical protein ACPLYD_12705 [Anaerolineae bacterium]
MKAQELEQLVRKYYGYVADMEGSGVEIPDMLFVRDKIQRILDQSLPEDEIPTSLYERVHDLDRLLWEERETFLMVIGEQELECARQQQHSPRSHWWWYLDELKAVPQPLKERADRLHKAFAPTIA